MLALVLPMLTGFSMPENGNDSTCPAPENVSITAKTSGSISFDWDAVGGGSYLVYYVRQDDDYISPTYSTTNSEYSFSGLSAGTYDFFFVTDCGSELSGGVGIEDIPIN